MSPPPFQRFFDDHRTDVFGFLVALVGPDDADDCFQETFLAALRAYPRLRDGSNLRAWVLTIAHRKGVDVHRRRKAAPPLPPEPSWVDVHDDGEPELWRAVGALPPKQRAAVMHRFIDDLAYEDIGRALGCSAVAARRNVHEGVKKLREVVQ